MLAEARASTFLYYEPYHSALLTFRKTRPHRSMKTHAESLLEMSEKSHSTASDRNWSTAASSSIACLSCCFSGCLGLRIGREKEQEEGKTWGGAGGCPAHRREDGAPQDEGLRGHRGALPPGTREGHVEKASHLPESHLADATPLGSRDSAPPGLALGRRSSMGRLCRMKT